jgi:hypothetical protein
MLILLVLLILTVRTFYSISLVGFWSPLQLKLVSQKPTRDIEKKVLTVRVNNSNKMIPISTVTVTRNLPEILKRKFKQ